MLSHERLLEALEYRPDTGQFFWRIVGGPRSIGKLAGCIKDTGYREIGLDGKLYKAHRLAWFYVYGAWPSERLDHRYGDRDNKSHCQFARGRRAAKRRQQNGCRHLRY